MKPTNIYQTLENRGNKTEVEEHGPYCCHLCDSNGNTKTGIREPWLGEGYYFWDTSISDARWWGGCIYRQQGYFIGETQYDAHSEYLFDLVGDKSHFDEFIECAKSLQEKTGEETITFPYVLRILKQSRVFRYKAIRVHPYPKRGKKPFVLFPSKQRKSEYSLPFLEKIQICFFDKTLLTNVFKIVEKVSPVKDLEENNYIR